jgi:hypothetical protein
VGGLRLDYVDAMNRKLADSRLKQGTPQNE